MTLELVKWGRFDRYTFSGDGRAEREREGVTVAEKAKRAEEEIDIRAPK